MSKANPQKAIAALIPAPIRLKSDDAIAVAPMTLGMYAALERIGSPLVTGLAPKDTLELIPSLYLVTHDPREVFKGNILDLAMEWSIALPVSVVAEIREAAERQMSALLDVLPEVEKKKTCRKETAGSRTGSATAPRGSGGAGEKSYGKRQPLPSPSRSGESSRAGRSR